MKSMMMIAAQAVAYQAGPQMDEFIFAKRPNPIYQPKKHTVESYRSQQRKAKKRKQK
jgi:hypothetical protein